ncbi:hypothetical protein MUK42_37271 [Musa troglodytarum]|uniref:Uncharacterized protein n=1 Tax=Musa troglodytarum TaxID=320322 RepID=A0A9E7JB73_9LILI|nr:hypothetical protein MUK42_37271 [Musa troglodytarum]URD74043.1 hypothetical protein MUK42_37271 [Musa troglodytarum]
MTRYRYLVIGARGFFGDGDGCLNQQRFRGLQGRRRSPREGHRSLPQLRSSWN